MFGFLRSRQKKQAEAIATATILAASKFGGVLDDFIKESGTTGLEAAGFIPLAAIYALANASTREVGPIGDNHDTIQVALDYIAHAGLGIAAAPRLGTDHALFVNTMVPSETARRGLLDRGIDVTPAMMNVRNNLARRLK